jgi:hypothetical protein
LHPARAGIVRHIQCSSHLNHQSTSSALLNRHLCTGIFGFSRESLSSVKDFADAPPLVTAERPAFNNKHPITDMTFASFIVRLHLGAATLDFFILGVHHRALDGNHYSFLHPVADN